MYYVYLLKHTESGERYIGYTEDLRRRLREHNEGKNASTRRKEGLWELIYYEAFKSKEDAILREKRLKQHGKSKQELYNRLKGSL